MKKTRSDEEGDRDMISELPEDVSHKIFNPDVYKHFLDNGEDGEIQRKTMRLYECLERLLRIRQSIEKFKIKLEFFNDLEYKSFVRRYVCYAIGSNAKKMKLDSPYEGLCILPPIVLCAKSIEVLKLTNCKVELPTGSNVRLPSLIKVHLFGVNFEDHVSSNLFSGCPLIEEIICSGCKGFETVELFDLYRLNKIKIRDDWYLKQVNIKNLNVSSLTVFGWTIRPCGTISPCKISVYHCMNLRKISFGKAFIKDDWLCKTISKLLVLECL
ncbi:hypothetical protein Ddye_003936 [Dipteronia dyeriana]|uniref:Uncharacterized protein n=1 Tax=Dipteronia dyeriana TaxID=168575 RepID=A0AAD9XTR5_9ROSI|nr:hypothetical protein Ddye_003936 [Dipteronia dyeriana]